MRTIYKFYKERLIEINGKNRSLYSKNISKKYAYDIGRILGNDTNEIATFIDFIWKGKRKGYTIVCNSFKDKFFYNFGLDEKIKKDFKDTTDLSVEEVRNENLRRERLKKEETKKSILREVNHLKALKREIEEFAKETGRYELFIGYPFVTGGIGKDLLVKGPLILFPVVINIENETTVSFELKHNESIQMNKVLLLAYAKQNKLNIDNLILEFDNLIDYNFNTIEDVLKYLENFDIKINNKMQENMITFDKIKEPSFSDKLTLYNSCVIGRFPLANSIYNDYSILDKKKLSSDAIDELLESRRSKKVKKPDTRLFSINDLDFAQENAIESLNLSGNMVIYGPPGTGKSQTIVNIISDAICKNKRVLVVSQKRAALDVVFNRLKTLNSKCMFLTDAEKNKVDFYERCKQTHFDIMENFKPLYSLQEFNKVETDLQNEIKELEDISSVLFDKTPFGLSLQEMYANSSQIGKNSSDYEYYQILISNKEIMKMNYDELSNTLRLIKEKNKADLYNRFIELKKQNPLIDHIKPDLDIRLLGEAKTFISELLQKRLVPFDTSNYKYSRQLLSYYLENDIKDRKDLKPLVKMIFDVKNKKMSKFHNFSKIFFVFYPISKHFVNKKQNEIKNNFDESLSAMLGYMNNFSILEKVLDRKGYIMTIDNVINGNNMFLKLLLTALEDYVEIRDINTAIHSFTEKEKVLLSFAYENTNSLKAFKSLIDKILEIRIYQETVNYEELYKNTLSKIIDFENIRNRVLSLKEEEKNSSIKICIDKFKQQYIDLYESNVENKNYLYQITKQQGLLPIRKMMEIYGDLLLTLFPCWLLSPESVSQIMPLKRDLFDIILFDEASQIFIENTIPVIYRGKYIVVAGDSKQLRPTSTFMKRYLGYDGDEELSQSTMAALEVESLLDLATSRYTSANLTYHYRSKSEELINFSNYAFYDGKLQIAPNISKKLGKKPIERIKVDGRWLNRKNITEAETIANLIRTLLKNRKNNESIGVITFNTEQEGAIDDAIDKLCNKDIAFRNNMLKERNRFENGEDTSIFIKNLENVQGDERDIIIFSIGYAKNEYGKVIAHFGPLSVEGGENRLNVAITRAKSKIYVVTSIEPEELNVEGTKNLGPKIFKNYLTYVRAISNNDKKEAQFVLDKFKPVTLKGSENLSGRIEVEIKEELEKLGYTVETNLGNTNYKISIAIYDKKLDRYLLGLECDYSAFASSESILERDVYRNKFLESRGWKILRIWSRDWWLNKAKVLQKIVKTLETNRKNFIKK